MIPDRKQRRLKEFCVEGNLQEYSNILEQIFNEIEFTGCRISARYDTEASNHNYETDGCRIQISLKKRYNNPLEVIWTILHEFGHHHSGKAKTSRLSRDQKLIRENEAWEIAQEIINKYPELSINIDDFIRFKKECLQTYIDLFIKT